MHPAINLAVAVGIMAIAFVLLRPQSGWFWGWQRRRQLSERVLTEDALKHLNSCQEAGGGASVDSLAGALEISRNEASELAQRLEQRGLLYYGPAGLQLSDEGSRYALQVVRTHRLWEQYLAEQTGIAEREWHERADRVEHQLTPAQVDALSARMGDPVFDPHGDPIPSAAGTIHVPVGKSLNAMPPGSFVRIVHIEDEPESMYRVLRDAQLQSGMVVSVVNVTSDGIELDTGASRRVLAPLVAANVTAQLVEPEAAEGLSLRRLSALSCGQEARVTDISPACRGVERRRLLDLGLVPGTLVKAELASPGRDPIAYRVRGALIALRAQQADMIHISEN